MVKKYITMRDMQELTGLADSTLYDHVSKGVIPAPTKRKVRIGRGITGPVRDIIEAWNLGRYDARLPIPIVIEGCNPRLNQSRGSRSLIRCSGTLDVSLLDWGVAQ